MSDDLKNRGPQDAAKINLHESWEARYWSEKFGVSKERLEEAVKAVGTGAKKAEEYLKS